MATDFGIERVSSSKFPPVERVVCSVYASTPLPGTVATVPDDGSVVVVPFDAVEYDPDRVFDRTNNVFVIPKTAPYRIEAVVCWLDTAPVARLTSILAVLKDGSMVPDYLIGKGWGNSQIPPTGTNADVVPNIPGATVRLGKGDRVGVLAAVQVATPVGATYSIIGITGGPFRATTASLFQVN